MRGMEESTAGVGRGRKASGAALVACLAMAFSLASAQAASAAMGVYETFGSTGSKGGEFNTGINDVAVNSNGAGGVNAGDVYVVDRGNDRIQRFDADGNFISAWGLDVDAGGGTGYEVCEVAANCQTGSTASGVGGALSDPRAIAVDQANGNVYVADRFNRRVQQFSAVGVPLRAWGQDVVSSGAEQADERQRLTVDAGAGQYKLTFGAKTTADIEWNEPAAGIETKLNALESIGTGNVTVSGGVGGVGGTTPYLIAFGGSLADTNQSIITVSAGTAPLAGGAATAAIATINEGAVGVEVCETATNCKTGVNASPAAIPTASTGGAFSDVGEAAGGLTTAPAGAPNAGNVLVADSANRRIQEFTATGAFVRAFGRDTVSPGPGNAGTGFEVCNATSLDVCKSGNIGTDPGEFGGNSPNRIAEDSSGNIYTVESRANFRVQRFTLSGNVVSPQGDLDPSELTGTNAGEGGGDTPIAVAVDTSTGPGTPGTVYVLKYFPQGFGSPPLAKKEARILEVDPEANGNGKVTATFLAKAEIGVATGLARNHASGRLYVTAPSSPVYVVDEVPPTSVSLGATEVGATTATLHATITPSPLPKLPTLYRFEYAKVGGEWKQVPSSDADIGKGPAPVTVSQAIEGLEINTCYELRAIAHSRYYGAEDLAEGEFCTEPVPPEVTTGEARWSSPPASGPSLTLNGTINPGNDQTTYFFEYVSEEAFQASGFDSAGVIPALPASAGHGLFDVAVLQSIPGLDPSKTYRYRLVATNSVGTKVGEERTVSPPDPSARFYELVANAESNGLGVAGINAVSDDGERVALTAQTLGDPNSLPAQNSPFLALRGGGGWNVAQVTPDPLEGRGGNVVSYSAWFPADLATALWAHYSPAGQIRGEVSWTFTDPDGAFRQALPTLVPVSGRGTVETLFTLTGGAADLSSFVFQRQENSGAAVKVPATYVPGQPPTTGEPGDIYRVSGAGGPSPSLTLLNRDPAGNLISNACGAWVGAFRFPASGNPMEANKGLNARPVSADGSVTYFSARPSGSTACSIATDRIRVFKRIGDSSTVEVSKSQCTRTAPTPCSAANSDDFFQAASADGNRVFFTTTRQLTDSDEDSTADLYLYDSSPPAGQPTLVQTSAGEVGAEHPKVGSGAEMPESGGTAFGGVVDVAADGSRVYFVAKGQLAAGAVKGDNNLYVFQRDAAHPTGRIAFIAKLETAGDASLWGASTKAAFALPFEGVGGEGDGDGRFLLFASQAKLLGADTDSKADLYRYDDVTASLACLTCAGNGNFAVSVANHGSFSDPATAQRNRIAAEDLSRVVFATAEPLVGEDKNTVSDAYEWHEGGLRLISPGYAGSAGAGAPMLSADGAHAFFLTADRILPADTNSAVDAYDAHIGGGFPEAGEPQGCVSADGCRTAPVVAPPLASVTSTLPGPGNPAAKPPKCAKGKVQKKGRCVKKAKKKRSHQRRANDERGAKR